MLNISGVPKFKKEELNVTIKIENDRNIAQLGSVLEWGSRGLGFKSRYSDHFLIAETERKGK